MTVTGHRAATGSDETRREEEKIDESVEETFPASDPPSFTPGTAGSPTKPEGRRDSA